MVELVTQREKAYREIKNGILNFKWRPGVKLVERQLSEEIGVSRTPIRESLNRLEKEGLIKHIPQWGVYVKKLNKEDIIEMYEVREALEGVGARLAASRATQDDLNNMRQALEKMEQALLREGGENTRAYDDADNEFHNLLVKASHNKKLMDLASMCHMHVEELPRMKVAPLGDIHKQLLEEHKQILDSIVVNNGIVAEELIHKHISEAKKKAEQFFQELGRD